MSVLTNTIESMLITTSSSLFDLDLGDATTPNNVMPSLLLRRLFASPAASIDSSFPKKMLSLLLVLLLVSPYSRSLGEYSISSSTIMLSDT
jgi:hypothetical protein